METGYGKWDRTHFGVSDQKGPTSRKPQVELSGEAFTHCKRKEGKVKGGTCLIGGTGGRGKSDGNPGITQGLC